MKAFYTDPGDDALLICRGPDAVRFLQGQLTCDVNSLTEDHAVPGALCNLKGRVVADFLLVLLQPDTIAIRLRRDMLQHVHDTLARYIVFSKAELEPANAGWRLLACWGGDCETALAPIFSGPAEAQYSVQRRDGALLVRTGHEDPVFECYIPPQQQTIASELAGALTEATPEDWTLQRIRHAEARVGQALAETEPPQAFNFDRSGHLSFSKGCYTGQEVVARLHYRGRSKWRLYRATLPTVFDPGTELAARTGRTAARVLACARNSEGTVEALLMATAQAASPGLEIDGNTITATPVDPRDLDND